MIRSHFIALVLRRACWNFQQLPSFENYGRKIRQEKIVATLTDELPAQMSLVELSMQLYNIVQQQPFQIL